MGGGFAMLLTMPIDYRHWRIRGLALVLEDPANKKHCEHLEGSLAATLNVGTQVWDGWALWVLDF